MVPWVGLHCVIVVFPDHTHLLLDVSITHGIVSSKFYNKCDDFNFEIFNLPYQDGDFPPPPLYGVYISQAISFARVCSNVIYITESIF